MSRRARLTELGVLFLRLGTTAFGGPAAHIAMMDEEVVERRKWLSRDEFLDLLGATNLIPGPNSTELALHIGHKRAGIAGLLVAGIAFILPAASITLALAWIYVRFGRVPAAAGVLYGIKPVMIAVVLQALWGFGRTALKSPLLRALGALSLAAAALGVEELIVLLGGGALSMLAVRAPRQEAPPALLALAPLPAAVPMAVASSSSLFVVFAKIGSVLFGSGYVLLAFLREDLVEKRGWLTEAQLIDAVAVGQLTPGPVFTTATFVGYLIHGVGGAAAATIGIFLPAFVFVALSGRLVPRLRRSPRAGAFLDGVNVASLALMVIVTLQLGRSALVDVPTLALAALSLLLLRRKVSSLWLILGGAVAGTASLSLH